MPWIDWALAIAGAFAGIYLLVFYSKLATRLGQPKPMPSRWPSPASLAALFIAYAMLGPHMPEVLRHKVASLNRLMSHLCLTTEGVYGIALGVSTGTIFVYVLLGTLLDRAGGS